MYLSVSFCCCQASLWCSPLGYPPLPILRNPVITLGPPKQPEIISLDDYMIIKLNSVCNLNSSPCIITYSHLPGIRTWASLKAIILPTTHSYRKLAFLCIIITKTWVKELKTCRVERLAFKSWFVTAMWYCCRKGDPFQGLKLGSCLTLGNELPEETHVLTKQEILLGKGAGVESRTVREPRRTFCHMVYSLGFMVMGIVSGCL